MDDAERLARLRSLRSTLTNADTDGRGIWTLLCERFPLTSHIATSEAVLAALDLAYEIGYEDGESSS